MGTIAGYTRENARLLSSKYPKEINALIEMYLLIEWLRWNIDNTISDKYEFVDGPLQHNRIRSISGNRDVVIMANPDFAISSAFYDRFYFVIEFPSHSMDFWIGYVPMEQAEKLRKNPRYFLGG